MLSNRDWAESISEAWGHDTYRIQHGMDTAEKLVGRFKAETLKLAAERATKAIKNYGIPTTAYQSYSPVRRRDFATELIEAAILDENQYTRQYTRPDCSGCRYFTNFSDVAPCRICQRAGPNLISSYQDYYEEINNVK